MRKLVVLMLVLGMASLANAVMVSATGTATGDGYVMLSSDGTMSNFAAGPANPSDVAPSSKAGTAQEFTEGGLATGLYANGEGWSIGTLGAYPITGSFLTADVDLDVIVGTGSMQSVVGTSTTTDVLGTHVVEEVVVDGTWYRTFEDRLIKQFNDVLTQNYNQMGANVMSAFIDATTFEQTNWSSEQLLGAQVNTTSSNELVQTGSFNESVMIDEYFVAIPEPATLAILGLGGLLLRRKKA